MFDLLRAVVGKAAGPGVHGGDMEKAPTVPVRSATSMMSGAVRRMRSVSAPMFFFSRFFLVVWVGYYLLDRILHMFRWWMERMGVGVSEREAK